MKFNEIRVKEDNLSSRKHVRHEKLDHEVHMAKSDLLSLAQDARDLLMLLQKYGSEERGIPGWIASKITKAQDYIKSVHKSLSYDSMDGEISEMFGISSNAKHRAKTIAMLDKMGIDSEKSGRNGLIIKGVAKPDQKILLGKIRSDIGMFNSYTMDDINENEKFEITHDPVGNIDKILKDMVVDSPTDLIADILHWCDRNNQDFDKIVAIGRRYYEDELKADSIVKPTNEDAGDLEDPKEKIRQSIGNIEKVMDMMVVDSPADIIADIKHWCDHNNKNFDNIVAIGDQYYGSEIRSITSETASAGSTSAGAIATVANPHITRYKGPKPKKQKPSDNALNMKNVSIFGGPKKRK